MRNCHAGGTIYIWTLGGDKTAHTVARDFGHDAALVLLNRRSPVDLQFVVACDCRRLAPRRAACCETIPG